MGSCAVLLFSCILSTLVVAGKKLYRNFLYVSEKFAATCRSAKLFQRSRSAFSKRWANTKGILTHALSSLIPDAVLFCRSFVGTGQISFLPRLSFFSWTALAKFTWRGGKKRQFIYIFFQIERFVFEFGVVYFLFRGFFYKCLTMSFFELLRLHLFEEKNYNFIYFLFCVLHFLLLFFL